MVFTILITFISLIGLIVLHELGHFIAAKKFGVKVEEFGVGLPPRLIGKKFGETLYSLNLLPFGAFVKIYGEEGEVEDYRSFSGRPIWQRAIIIVGGVVTFWISTAVLLSVLGASTGIPMGVSDEADENLINPKVQIIGIAPDSPAQTAGIEPLDTILELNSEEDKVEINRAGEVQEFTKLHQGEEITLRLERGQEILEKKLIPRSSPPEGQGAIGISLARVAQVKFPWYEAPFKGIELTGYLTSSIVVGISGVLGNVFQGKGMPPGVEIMGPVRIGILLNQAAQTGTAYFLFLIARISVYLAIFNILTVPALVGGKLLFLGIEAVRKKPISAKIEQNITAFFFLILIGLMIFVTIKEIFRIVQ